MNSEQLDGKYEHVHEPPDPGSAGELLGVQTHPIAVSDADPEIIQYF